MILQEYERNLKNILEEPDNEIREVIYYAIASAIVDQSIKDILDKGADLTINSLVGTVTVNQDKFLSKIVELTIVDVNKLENAIKNELGYRRSLFSGYRDIKAGVEGNLRGCFGLTNFYSYDLLSNIDKYRNRYVNAYTVTKLYFGFSTEQAEG